MSQFESEVYLPNVEAGKSMFRDSGFYLLPSEEKDDLKHITLNRLDENFSFVDSVHLKFANDSFYHYVGPAMAYNGKYIVTGTAQNAFGYGFGRTVVFVLNKDLTLHDTLVIKPVRQLIKPVDLAVNPADGFLYISMIYDNFHPQDSTFLPLDYQRIVKLDSTFHLTDFWQSDDYINFSTCPITFSESGTMYTSYSYSSFDYIVAIDPSGQVSWKTPLDTFIVVGPTVVWLTSRKYSVADVTVASNGDILVVGSVDATQYDIGLSSLLARLRPDGQIKWTKIIRSNLLYSFLNLGYRSRLNSVLELPGGDIVAGGGLEIYDAVLAPNEPFRFEAWVVCADSNGCISPACGYIQDVNQKITYFPIVNPANEWTVRHVEWGAPFPTLRKYRFTPDSVLIGGKYYHELTYVDSFFGAHDTNRFYREENGIVYRSNGAVLYNLDLGPIDTLPSYVPEQGARTVSDVGTVIFNDGLPRKTMTIYCASDSFAPPVTVVEGMGDLEDFFHSEKYCINPLDGPSDHILCFSVNGEIVYQVPGETCDLTSTSQPVRPIVSIHPNPAEDLIYIEMPTDQPEPVYQVRIFNTLGSCLSNQSILSDGHLLLVDVSVLPPGSYWGVVYGDGGGAFSFGFLKFNR
ncbi:MAG: T9SS type A sorting domain-containing protein [Saprospiraceae bacterium]|nr:T9SS type A sorting domain-containing protein [Saprospiraceae bacterium]